MGWGKFGLHYIRTRDGQEVDFLVSENGRPMFLVEAKCGEDSPAKALTHVMTGLRVPGIQLLDQGERFRHLPHAEHPLLIAPAAWWLPILP
jgi:hypothetical protein